MKNKKQFLFLLICLTTVALRIAAQTQYTGLPGDNFSLQGALDMFRQSTTIEQFEQKINTQTNLVNNLDLDEDGKTDYVQVIDRSDKDIHAFVLQVAVTASENQDIAVIELEKTGDTTAMLQIIGDEEIYGEQIVVEPSSEGDELEIDNTVNIHGPSILHDEASRFVINVFYWPSVRFVYRSAYIPWISPWRWRHYPVWWKPWHPFAWNVFHPGTLAYHRQFAVVRTHRMLHAHRIYTPYRTCSVVVRNKTRVARNNYYLSYSRNRVISPGGYHSRITNARVHSRPYHGRNDRDDFRRKRRR